LGWERDGRIPREGNRVHYASVVSSVPRALDNGNNNYVTRRMIVAPRDDTSSIQQSGRVARICIILQFRIRGIIIICTCLEPLASTLERFRSLSKKIESIGRLNIDTWRSIIWINDFIVSVHHLSAICDRESRKVPRARTG
jgi:hypothetical protein